MCGDTFRHIAFALLPLVMLYEKTAGAAVETVPAVEIDNYY